jgi:hypothetical protein
LPNPASALHIASHVTLHVALEQLLSQKGERVFVDVTFITCKLLQLLQQLYFYARSDTMGIKQEE